MLFIYLELFWIKLHVKLILKALNCTSKYQPLRMIPFHLLLVLETVQSHGIMLYEDQ